MPARRVALTSLIAVMVLFAGIIGLGVSRGGWQPGPHLALDLEGGTQVILTASSRDGEPIDATAMEQARQIMEQRINAMGVAETEISVQGGSNIVVDVPGTLDQETSDALRQAALMSFRPVLGITTPEGTDSASAGAGASDAGGASEQTPDTEEASAPIDPSQGVFAGVIGQNVENAPSASGPRAWTLDSLTPEVQELAVAADCTDPRTQQDRVKATPADQATVACDPDGTAKFVLGPEVVPGSAIARSSVGSETTPTGQPTGFFAVNMEFASPYGERFSEMTTALFSGEGVTTQFAIVLDGQVISAPEVQAPSPDGTASITGQFTQEQAQQLSDQLRYGALPLEFDVSSEQQISATLGEDQLRNGLIAGLIGLLLVVAYAFLQYRLLAAVTTASLVVMGVLAYETLTIMSNMPDIGFRLSLAGVVGLIVSIAFTADSFIVYFERVRDEIREGRGIAAAVDHGWRRSRHTILASDAVNLIAAVVLYVLSTGGVRGFALTLGIATILDLIVVFFFTHPVLSMLVQTRFFGKGHPLSGLDPNTLGRNLPAYAGRGRVRTESERNPRGRKSSADDTTIETLAERKRRRELESRAERRDEPVAASGTGEPDEAFASPAVEVTERDER